MKNEIFAVKGYQFENPVLRHYFSQQEWYRPVHQNVELSAIEKKNVAIIQNKLEGLKASRTALIEQLNLLKYAESNELLTRWEITSGEGAIPHLLTLLKGLDLEPLAQSGIHITSIEDGVFLQTYRAIIEGDELLLSYHIKTSDRDLLSEYSEDYIQWRFKLENGKLIFQD